MYGHRAQITSEAIDASPALDWVVPIALLCIGLAARLLQVTAMRHEKVNLGAGLMIGLASLAIGCAAAFAGVFGVASFMGTELPDAVTLARKVAAIGIFTTAVAVFCASFDRDLRDLRGPLVAVHAILLLLFVLYAYLLKLDLLEALAAAVIGLLVNAALLLILSQALGTPLGRFSLFAV